MAVFVDINGVLKPNDIRSSKLIFDHKSEHMGMYVFWL